MDRNGNRPQFTQGDIGCWIDSAYGMGHAVKKMRQMLTDCTGSFDVANGIIGPINNDTVSEELDAATEYLESVTDTGLAWLWEAGDLILTTEEGNQS